MKIKFSTTCAAAALALALAAASGCSDDTDNDDGKADAKVVQKDTGAPDTSADLGQYSGPNSGKRCKGDTDCTNTNEKCLFGPKSSTWGMCLMTCTPGTTCPHPAPGPYASECKFSYKASSGTTSYACGWYCAYQGVDYKCPNDTDYECWAPNSSEPHVKFCVPK